MPKKEMKETLVQCKWVQLVNISSVVTSEWKHFANLWSLGYYTEQEYSLNTRWIHSTSFNKHKCRALDTLMDELTLVFTSGKYGRRELQLRLRPLDTNRKIARAGSHGGNDSHNCTSNSFSRFIIMLGLSCWCRSFSKRSVFTRISYSAQLTTACPFFDCVVQIFPSIQTLPL
jgi:hypothetical protein